MTIVTPALRAANNGNWRTAYRWSRFLRPRFDVDVRDTWTPAASSAQCLIALHARRSSGALACFADAFPHRPRILVLTGTDLYRDVAADATARRSLDVATQIVVLQEAALEAIDARHRRKCRVIYQSARSLAPGTPRKRSFDVLLVGHMRAEKDPATPMRALLRLPAASRVRLVHIGEALSDDYERMARELVAHPWPSMQRYRWLGGRGHAETRRRIRDAQAMVISSVMEGGANVIVEAITCGVPVVASCISGNVGMLGRDYDGYFPAGDDESLARLLERISCDDDFLAHLRRQCAARAPLFDPRREHAEVNRLVDDALVVRGPRPDDGNEAKEIGSDQAQRAEAFDSDQPQGQEAK